jgi:hypothetical protein
MLKKLIIFTVKFELLKRDGGTPEARRPVAAKPLSPDMVPTSLADTRQQLFYVIIEHFREVFKCLC